MTPNNHRDETDWTGSLPGATATYALAHWLGRRISCGTVVTLTGPLGVGKTTFAQGLLAGLGVEEPVISPTFILLNRYTGRCPVGHVDLYRLRPNLEDEIFLPELAELLDGETVLVVEWAERLANWWPAERLQVELVYMGDPAAGRRVRLRPGSPPLRRLLQTLADDLPQGVATDAHPWS